MLAFAVFDGDGPAKDWPLDRAYLFGQDNVAVSGEIRFSNGLVICRRTSDESTGLAVQYHVGQTDVRGAELSEGEDVGPVMLQTCLLPSRSEPYLLSLELARHRVMLVLNKLEDWGLFDLPSDDPVISMFERAREKLTEALVVRRDSEGSQLMADRLARESLFLAVEAGERLTERQAQRQLAGRLSGDIYDDALVRVQSLSTADDPPTEGPLNPPGVVGVVLPPPPQIGCVIGESQFSEHLQRVVTSACDFVTLPMRWVDMEPTEGRYSFAKTDRWIEWAVRRAKLDVAAGPVIDFRPRSIPEWLYIWEHDYETLRELIYEHIKNIVTRYRRTVSRWTIVSGLNVNSNFTFTFEQVMDLTRMCVLMVRKLQPSAWVQIEVTEPWGEYYGRNPRSIPPVLYAEMCGQAGMPFDALALRLQMGDASPGRTTRDMMAMSALLDRYAALDRPITISAIGAPSGPPPGDDGQDPGSWHRPWNEQAQMRWLSQAVSIALSKPYVHSVCWHELYDRPDAREMALGGLLNADGSVKPAAERLVEIRRSLKNGVVS